MRVRIFWWTSRWRASACGSGGDGGYGGAPRSGLIGGDVIERLSQLHAADVGGTVRIWADRGLREKTDTQPKDVVTETRWMFRIVQP